MNMLQFFMLMIVAANACEFKVSPGDSDSFPETVDVLQLSNGNIAYRWFGTNTTLYKLSEHKLFPKITILKPNGKQLIEPIIMCGLANGTYYDEYMDKIGDDRIGVIYQLQHTDFHKIEMYIFDNNGKIMNERILIYGDERNYMPRFLALKNGNIVVIWTHSDSKGTKYYVIYAIYDKNMNLIRTENIMDEYNNTRGRIYQLENGNIIIRWQRLINSTHTHDVYFQMYTENFEKIREPLFVDGYKQGTNSEDYLFSFNNKIYHNNQNGNYNLLRVFDNDLNIIINSTRVTDATTVYPPFTRSSYDGTNIIFAISLNNKGSHKFTVDPNSSRVVGDVKISCETSLVYHSSSHCMPNGVCVYAWKSEYSPMYVKSLICSNNLLLTTNELNINNNQTITMTIDNIHSRFGCDKTNVTYYIKNMTHLVFMNNNVSVDTFTSDDILDGHITVKHDGSNMTPSYDVIAQYNEETTKLSSAKIVFNDIIPHELVHNNSYKQSSSDDTSSSSCYEMKSKGSSTDSANEKSESDSSNDFNKLSSGDTEKSESSSRKYCGSHNSGRSETPDESHKSEMIWSYVSSSSDSSNDKQKMNAWEIAFIALSCTIVVTGGTGATMYYIRKKYFNKQNDQLNKLQTKVVEMT